MKQLKCFCPRQWAAKPWAVLTTKKILNVASKSKHLPVTIIRMPFYVTHSQSFSLLIEENRTISTGENQQ